MTGIHRVISMAVLCFFLSGCAVFSKSYESDVTAADSPYLQSALSSENNWLVFADDPTANTTLVFYPGGKVQPEAYSGLATELVSTTGIRVVIVPMPLDLAVLGSKRGESVQLIFPDTQRWLIGGHSLGGTMAAGLFHDRPERWHGLVLLASYPQDKHDMSTASRPVISIIGDRDGLISVQQWQNSLTLLPPHAQAKLIEGGNHAGFGSYGPQADDETALMKPEQQQNLTVQLIKRWLNDDE